MKFCSGQNNNNNNGNCNIKKIKIKLIKSKSENLAQLKKNLKKTGPNFLTFATKKSFNKL